MVTQQTLVQTGLLTNPQSLTFLVPIIKAFLFANLFNLIELLQILPREIGQLLLCNKP